MRACILAPTCNWRKQCGRQTACDGRAGTLASTHDRSRQRSDRPREVAGQQICMCGHPRYGRSTVPRGSPPAFQLMQQELCWGKNHKSNSPHHAVSHKKTRHGRQTHRPHCCTKLVLKKLRLSHSERTRQANLNATAQAKKGSTSSPPTLRSAVRPPKQTREQCPDLRLLSTLQVIPHPEGQLPSAAEAQASESCAAPCLQSG
mmetsp:Transcript_100395/g.312849  ORF Transcript_100395/g.312849 Transcript_100395/m.312849 type:complete len:203 (-) Transcript_100395:443-1051(-)